MNTSTPLLNRLKHPPAIRWAAGGLVLVALAAAGWWQRSAAAQPANAAGGAPAPVTAQVKVAAIESTRITTTTVAYGTVTARPGKSNTLSLPFECVVRHVLVAPGESVAAGQPVLEIGPSPATRLKIAQAKAALAAADDELQQIRDRYNLNFATNQDLSQARKAADAARLDWENLAGIEKQGEVVAELPAIVAKAWVQDGQFVPAGQPLAELVPHDQIEVKFGLEPGDEDHLQAGDTVKLSVVGREQAPAITGRIRLVTHRISPDTQLVAVYVTPPPGTPLLLDDYLRGDFNLASNVGLVVPRAALLPEGDANVLYTVSGGHAVRHAVRTGLSTGQQVEVVGDGLQAGQQIVVTGNHELSDGMAVALNPEP